MKKIMLVMVSIFLLLIVLNQKEEKKEEELRGVFISYIELSEQLKGKKEEIAKKNIDQMIQNIHDLKLNTIILQVRANADAMYFSNIYPFSLHVSEREGEKTFDILEYFLKKCQEKDLSLIAWINPYRIRTTSDTSTITNQSPAYQYLNTDTIYIQNGIYWNPSKPEVEDLIIEGVKEVLSYKIDGLIFDDYFYPNEDIDQRDYETYQKSNPNITKKEYHLKIVNQLIEKIHKRCQEKGIPFGVSPDGNIENNYEKHDADVKKWIEDQSVDFLIPQIYYGFYHSTQGYVKVAEQWNDLLKSKDMPLYVALAFYKVGKEDTYAKEGAKEWLENDDIIMREILLSRNLDHYQGFVLFRYDHLFSEDMYTSKSRLELKNMKKMLK
ncbi:MAG: family 10 glycosylhydrolase [Bacilli bacterium]|nr:family 10 glycosylhydrolase [Bacilli bacterium]